MKKHFIYLILLLCLVPKTLNAQIDEGQLGAWYMYFYDTSFNESKWGVQGDVQFRNWDAGGDLEQLLLRSGLTYRPADSKVKLTLGYGHITTGDFGSSSKTTTESRIYQEALFPVQIAKGVYTKHRFRYEQRFVDGQDFRTRYRYNLFLNIPLNTKVLEEKTMYLALYNELFINSQRQIGKGKKVEIFDRNRLYVALGYWLKKDIKIQLGIMKQSTNNWAKNQLQFSFHHQI